MAQSRVILRAWTKGHNNRRVEERDADPRAQIQPGPKSVGDALPVSFSEVELCQSEYHDRRLHTQPRPETGDKPYPQGDGKQKPLPVEPIRGPRGRNAKLIKNRRPDDRLKKPAQEERAAGREGRSEQKARIMCGGRQKQAERRCNEKMNVPPGNACHVASISRLLLPRFLTADSSTYRVAGSQWRREFRRSRRWSKACVGEWILPSATNVCASAGPLRPQLATLKRIAPNRIRMDPVRPRETSRPEERSPPPTTAIAPGSLDLLERVPSCDLVDRRNTTRPGMALSCNV